jgi:uncharacterized protein involved in exopolysaccharide biosynthesis
LSEDVRSRTSQASETTRFLTREVARLEGELRGIESKTADYKLRNAEITNTVKQLEFEKRRLEAGSGLSMTNIDELNKQLSALKWELLQKSSLFSDGHPNIKTIKLQIAAVEREIAAGVKTGVAAGSALEKDGQKGSTTIAKSQSKEANSQTRASTDQRGAADKTLTDLRTATAKASEIEMGLNTLERQQNVVQRDLEEASRKLSAARLGESLERDQQAERFEILENPTVPQASSKPNRLLVLAMAFGIACMSGIGSVLGAEMLDKSIRTRSDLNRIVESHLIVTIPYVETTSEAGQRKQKIVLAAGGVLTIVVGLVAVYLLMPSIGTMIRQVFSVVLG